MAAHPCPICKREFFYEPQTPPKSFPFCSEKCRMVDLGRWLSGAYRVSHPLDPDQAEEMQNESPGP